MSERARDHPRSLDAPGACWPTAAQLSLQVKYISYGRTEDGTEGTTRQTHNTMLHVTCGSIKTL